MNPHSLEHTGSTGRYLGQGLPLAKLGAKRAVVPSYRLNISVRALLLARLGIPMRWPAVTLIILWPPQCSGNLGHENLTALLPSLSRSRRTAKYRSHASALSIVVYPWHSDCYRIGWSQLLIYLHIERMLCRLVRPESLTQAIGDYNTQLPEWVSSIQSCTTSF